MRVGRTTEALPLAAPSTVASSPSEPPTDAVANQLDASVRSSSGLHPFSHWLRGVGQELDRGEAIAEKAIRGAGSRASSSPEQLIALQAGIYRYAEAVDLVTKLVDRGTQAVRTTLQSQ
jgi:hypothetical protein